MKKHNGEAQKRSATMSSKYQNSNNYLSLKQRENHYKARNDSWSNLLYGFI